MASPSSVRVGFSRTTPNGAGGADTLNGGIGSDTADYSGETANLTGDLTAGTATGGNTGDTLISIENVAGGSGNDQITGDGVANILLGNGGDDTIFGMAGNDVLGGGAGNDNLNGGTGNDSIRGNEGDDTLNGDAGTDTLIGGTGNDALNGGADRDILQGNDGSDTLNGGAGNDTMTGGAGADTFLYTSITDAGLTSATRDSIMDFEVGSDKIDLSAFNSQFGGDALVTIKSGSPTLTNYFIATVDADHNGTADFSISISTTSGALTLSDFILSAPVV